tara:strand:+ start:1554 stop:2768 length:1215 start_codon:yes stop_codon:yes gene_type:complete
MYLRKIIDKNLQNENLTYLALRGLSLSGPIIFYYLIGLTDLTIKFNLVLSIIIAEFASSISNIFLTSQIIRYTGRSITTKNYLLSLFIFIILISISSVFYPAIGFWFNFFLGFFFLLSELSAHLLLSENRTYAAMVFLGKPILFIPLNILLILNKISDFNFTSNINIYYSVIIIALFYTLFRYVTLVYETYKHNNNSINKFNRNQKIAASFNNSYPKFIKFTISFLVASFCPSLLISMKSLESLSNVVNIPNIVYGPKYTALISKYNSGSYFISSNRKLFINNAIFFSPALLLAIILVFYQSNFPFYTKVITSLMYIISYLFIGRFGFCEYIFEVFYPRYYALASSIVLLFILIYFGAIFIFDGCSNYPSLILILPSIYQLIKIATSSICLNSGLKYYNRTYKK